MILENRIKDKDFKVWIVNQKINAYIFALRHILKGGSAFSRFIYKKELNSFREEWEFYNYRNMAMIQKIPFLDKKSLENSNLFNGDFDLPNLYIAINLGGL